MKPQRLLFVILMSACASAPQKKVVVEAPKYKEKSMSRSLAEVPLSACDKSSWDKKERDELIGIASSCARSNQWNRVEQVGQFLSETDSLVPWGPYFLSLSASQAKDNERALWMIELALKKAPETGLLHYQKGRILWDMARYGEGMNEILGAVRVDGSLKEGHLFLGQVYFRDQEYDKAARHFHMVLDVEPNNAIALSGIAECLLQVGDVRGALDVLARASRAHPEQIDFKLRAAQVYEGVVKDPGQALAMYLEVKAQIGRGGRVPAQSDLDEKIRKLQMTVKSAAAKM